jgi:hypothetical protein
MSNKNEEELVRLQSDIDRTRERMSGTLETLVHQARQTIKDDAKAVKESVKTDVREAVAHAKESARAATIGKMEDLATRAGDAMHNTKDTLIDTVRQNPIPAALVGVGLVWLLMNRSSSARRRSENGHDNGSNGEHGPRRLLHAASDKIHDATLSAGQAMEHAAEKTSDLAHRAKDATGRGIQRAGEGIANIARQVPAQARRAERAAVDVYQEHPLAVGAAVLGVGAIIALSLPRTAREDELFGGARDRLVDRAKDLAHDASGAVRKLSEDAAGGLKDRLQASAQAGADRADR